MGTILIVDDEGKMRALLAMALDAEGYTVFEASSAEEALHTIPSINPDVIVTDVRMNGMTGLELVKTVRPQWPAIECIVMTAYADAQSGIEAMRSGALEYVAKPFEMDEMVMLVARAIEKSALRREVDTLKAQVGDRYALGSLIGQSKPMQEVIRQAVMVAGRDTTVLIRGHSGSGKELMARGIHAASGRHEFIAINCGAIPENLLESELFGHEKGAFTGAYDRKPGLFERAGEGTVFLDEIGDVTPALQVKLLRVLQEREFTRLGGTMVLHTSARIIAATNRNLEEAVKAHEFREDLYYRLNVFPLFVPSLCERTADIGPLVDFFLKKFKHHAGIEPVVLERLMEYSWPGNVRELENSIERATIMAQNGRVGLCHLPLNIRESRALNGPAVFKLPPEGISLDEVEKNLLLQAIDMAKGNKTRAAELLGISRRAIYSKMKTYGIAGAEQVAEPEEDSSRY